MTEIKKTLAILKTRWPEVVCLMALGLIALFFTSVLKIFEHVGRNTFMLLSAILPWIYLSIFMLFDTGFLRTVYLKGKKRQSMLVLPQVGKHFFLRILCFSVTIKLTSWLIHKLLLGTLLFLLPPMSSPTLLYWIIPKLCSALSSVILIKFALFIPALIIVLDCNLFSSWKFLKHCKLADAKQLVALFVFSLAFNFLLVFLSYILFLYSSPSSHTTGPYYIFLAALIIISRFIAITIGTMAIVFVASINLVYDGGPSSSNAEDSPEEQFKSSLED